MRWLFVLGLLGCGRIGFEPTGRSTDGGGGDTGRDTAGDSGTAACGWAIHFAACGSLVRRKIFVAGCDSSASASWP